MLGIRSALSKPFAPAARFYATKVTSHRLNRLSQAQLPDDFTWSHKARPRRYDDPTRRDDDIVMATDSDYNRQGMLKGRRIQIVRLSGLPLTATPQDIKALAATNKVANSLGRIEFMYDRHMRFTGEAMLLFAAQIHAINFAQQNSDRVVGDSVLKTRIFTKEALVEQLNRYYGYWPAEYQTPLDLIEYDTGKLVVLSNLPQWTTEARLEERLNPRYDLRPQDRWRGKRVSRANILINSKGFGGSSDVILGSVVKLPKVHPEATTASFLVRCQTRSEAQRLFRRWHNTYFAPASFPIQETAGAFRVQASILY